MVSDLIEKFEHNLDEYRNPRYKEAQIRVEFVNPFFEALGWDVHNKAGYSMSYRDVIHEDEVRVGRTTKAPDYSFRVGGTRVFFVETKKPAFDLKHDPAPAFQLRRYAYSAGLPVSILTDFEEFIVYDCRRKPDILDKSHVGRMFYVTFQEYTDKWDEIRSIFSKEAVMRGDLDRWVEDKKGKKPKAEIDRDFLADLDRWRIYLARNIALRNPELTQRELNYAVQLTIDRLIFLRMSEDRGIETQYTLDTLLNGVRVYPRLVEIYYRADERYNSGLFHFEERDGPNPDILTPSLNIDDKVLKEIIGELYYPKCPYEFSVLPVEVLGNAYEQFLGKVIRLTAGHHAKIEEKPEVRKAGGVYYTLQYIVDYIVKNTVGKLVEDKTVKEVADLRILDPACGSGSFLLGAYQYLMDWHLKQYIAEHEKTGQIPSVLPDKGRKKRKSDPPAIFQGMGEEWYLTTAEKKRILTNNIYGVDIDANAVEVTKLSLLLKVLEHESSETIHSQLKMWHERALPNLAGNIKCGNSLIGPDFYENQQAALFDEEEALRINAFDWEREFPDIFAKGGFDAVIGNPPYVRQEMLGDLKEYFRLTYEVYHGVADLYTYFVERGVNLLREGGYFSYIVANKWMRANYGKALRIWLKEQCIEELIDFGDLQIFRGETTYPCILRVVRQKPKEFFNAVLVNTLGFKDLAEYVKEHCYKVNHTKLSEDGWSLASETEMQLLEKLQSMGRPLGDYVNGKIYYGIKTGLNEAFVISREKRDELIAKDTKSEELIKPFLVGKDIKRYHEPVAQKFVIFTRRGVNIEKYPAIKEHLEQYKTKLRPKPVGFKGSWLGRKPGKYKWYEIQDTVDYYPEFENDKILWPGISAELTAFALDEKGYYGNDNNQLIISDDKYLLGIINSRLSHFILRCICDKVQGGFYRLKIIYIQQLPIYKIDFGNDRERNLHANLIGFVDQMLDLHKKLATNKEPRTREQLQRRIDATDRQIDRLVYELYGLTEEEIRVVEEG